MTLPCPGGQGGAAYVRIRRCLPCGQRRYRVARRIWVCREKKRFLKALCPSGGFAGAPGKAEPFVPFSVEGTATLSSAHERRKVHRPVLSRGRVFSLPSRGENGGLCPHPPKGPIPWESLFGDRPRLSPSLRPPKRRRRQAPARGPAACYPHHRPHAERNEAPMPPARGAWVRVPRAEGTGRPHCGQGAEVMVSEMRFSMASMP